MHFRRENAVAGQTNLILAFGGVNEYGLSNKYYTEYCILGYVACKIMLRLIGNYQTGWKTVRKWTLPWCFE
jgi:hypothetical protein